MHFNFLGSWKAGTYLLTSIPWGEIGEHTDVWLALLVGFIIRIMPALWWASDRGRESKCWLPETWVVPSLLSQQLTLWARGEQEFPSKQKLWVSKTCKGTLCCNGQTRFKMTWNDPTYLGHISICIRQPCHLHNNNMRSVKECFIQTNRLDNCAHHQINLPVSLSPLFSKRKNQFRIDDSREKPIIYFVEIFQKWERFAI